MSIEKYVKNQDKYPKGSKANIVGNDKKVERVGKAWYNNAEAIQIALIHLKDEYTTSEIFDSKECAAYLKGLNALPSFMVECYEEYEADGE